VGDVNDAAPTVVFVHGAADRGAAFARTGRHLPHVNVVRYDRRGYGRSLSAPLPGVSAPSALLAAQVDDLVAIIGGGASGGASGVASGGASGVGGAGVIVVGHSVGGLVALGAAVRSPLVAGVVAYEPPMPWAPWWHEGRQPHVRGRQPHLGNATPSGGDDSDPGEVMERFLRSMIGDSRWDALGPALQEARRAEGPALVGDLAAARGADSLDLAAVMVPVVLGFGSHTTDRHRRAITELGQLLAGAPCPVEVVEIAGAGHGAHLSHPEAFAGLVERCLELAGLSARAG
jgi:pimeloyl-ACP methyl ester carboxylesterase